MYTLYYTYIYTDIMLYIPTSSCPTPRPIRPTGVPCKPQPYILDPEPWTLGSKP